MAVFLCPLLAVMGGALGDLLVASKAPAYALATRLGRDVGMWNSKNKDLKLNMETGDDR